MAGDVHRRNLWIGIALIVIGVIGGTSLAVFLFADPYDNFRPSRIRAEGDFSSLGERIYLSGTNEQGQYIPRSRGSMHFASCADCHGRNGQGRVNSTMMFEFEAPDIRWSTLASPHGDEEGGEHIPYDRESFFRALRRGVEPDGEKLEPPMPRWQMSDREVDALIEYLQGL
jgi:cytochrome c oxidase subunit 2